MQVEGARPEGGREGGGGGGGIVMMMMDDDVDNLVWGERNRTVGEDYWTWSERKDKIFDNELKKGERVMRCGGGGFSGINENERKFIIKIKRVSNENK